MLGVCGVRFGSSLDTLIRVSYRTDNNETLLAQTVFNVTESDIQAILFGR